MHIDIRRSDVYTCIRNMYETINNNYYKLQLSDILEKRRLVNDKSTLPVGLKTLNG